jgi:hypothetical protein
MYRIIPEAVIAPPFFPPQPNPCLSCLYSALGSGLLVTSPEIVQPALAR